MRRMRRDLFRARPQIAALSEVPQEGPVEAGSRGGEARKRRLAGRSFRLQAGSVIEQSVISQRTEAKGGTRSDATESRRIDARFERTDRANFPGAVRRR